MKTPPLRPQVYLIARPSIDFAEFERFLADRDVSWEASSETNESEHLVEICGRLCYLSFTHDRSLISYPNAKYIRNLIDKGHDSVLEHATWTFIIDRVSRSFTHQLVRHRVGFAYSQLSQQYHDESSTNFVRPPGLTPEAAAIWQSATEAALTAYRKVLAMPISIDQQVRTESQRLRRSVARSILPNATETAIAVTANARALRHFLRVRGAILGDIEMRLVATAIYEKASKEAPSLFADFEHRILDDGWPAIIPIDGP